MKIELQAQLFSINAADPDGTPRRVVEGVAIPWNVEAVVSGGQRVKFLPGSLPTDGANPKFILGHDMTKPLGMVSERVSTPDAMLFSASLYDTNLANETLLQAGPGQFYDSVSVGVEPTDYSFEGSTMVVKAGNWTELSLLPFGAFEGAKVAVAAEAPETQDPTPTDSEEEPEVATQETPDTVEAAVPTQLIYAAPKREFKLPSAAEYIASFVRGGHDFAQLNENIRAAAPDVVTSDIPGVIPTPIIAPVYNNFQGRRPLIDATGVRAMPQSGAIFIRPVVTTHNSVGTATQNTTITASAFVVDDVQIVKTIQGGYVEISEASMDWSSPEVLGALLDDMARVYADRTDLLACSELVTGTTNTNNFANASITDPAEWVRWMYQAAADILTGSNGNLPSALAVSPNIFQYLGQLVDGSDRPLFPQVGPMNAYGTMTPGSDSAVAFGLRLVVDRNLGATDMVIMDPTGIECWEQQKGAISVEQPSQLSRQIAFRGYFAAKVIDPSKSIKAAFV
ncbi:hypothetical protein UFOVP1054_19 [uncultured Caudovirales phage]|uniref:Prohead protease n=1 Tax=uncultured Caudovirales phage TaxID=2100421 RepID=A0A6J5Q5N1_9CAUD|nr:hypothetical protein UFOVP1054_19 [uncultured Caudovirales phage]